MKKNFLLLFFGLIIFFPICLAKTTETIPVEIISTNYNKKDPKLIYLPDIQKFNKKTYEKKILKDNKQYQIYKKEISEEYYVLYRIFEKIARANNLYYQNWRIALKANAENLNAYAACANMIGIYSSLYDSLFDNEDALAFIISHELAHFLLGHHQTSLENNNKIEELQNKITQYQNNLYRGQIVSSINYNAKDTNSYDYHNENTNLSYALSIEALNMAIDKIYEQERTLEFEADFEAVTLMARAGYDVKKANDALYFLSNLPNIYTKRSAHPTTKERILNIDNAIELSNIQELQIEGCLNIQNSKVLNVKKSSDKETIVITKSQNNANISYTPNTKADKLIKKAYLYYLKDDITLAKKYFEEAFKLDETNYISALYLSYINEFEYLNSKNKKFIRKSGFWARKAAKLNPTNTHALKQKEEIIAILKEFKQKQEINR